MPSIFDDDDDVSDKPSAKPEQTIAKQNPAEIDLLQREPVKKETENLFRSLEKCDDIVVLAFKISEYMPNLTNKEAEKLWSTQIVPTLVDILKQDVIARSVVWDSFSAVRDLAISINEGATLVKELKGSHAAVKAAQATISSAFKKLESSIDAATKLSANAITTFGDKITALLQIMGDETANFVKIKTEYNQKLQEQYQKKKKLIDDISQTKEMMEMNNNMIHVTESKIIGAQAAIVETKRRAKELDELNKEVEKSIGEIASTYNVTETYTSSTKRSNKSYIIPNPNRDTQKQFYESIIKERVARIKAVNHEENEQLAVENQLKQDLCEYQAKYKTARDSLIEDEKMFREQMNKIQQEIDSLTTQLNEVYLDESTAATSTGLYGENLQKFLQLVTKLKTDTHQGAIVYKPLESALTAVRSMVNAHILLLESEDEKDIFTAGVYLHMKVAWLKEYHTISCEHLKTSVEYDDIKKRHLMKAIETA